SQVSPSPNSFGLFPPAIFGARPDDRSKSMKPARSAREGPNRARSRHPLGVSRGLERLASELMNLNGTLLMRLDRIQIDGDTLTPEAVGAVARGYAEVGVPRSSMRRVERCRKVVEKL